MSDLLYNISLGLVPRLYSGLTRLLFFSCRAEFHGADTWYAEMAKGPVIGAFWHYSIYYTMYVGRRDPLVAMVSASRDGEYVSRFLNRLGIDTVRGSKGKGKDGLKALLDMKKHMQENGRSAAIVADGSQGPARVVQPGAIILASRTGSPVFPVAWAADRYHAFGSWDRSVLPLPFARVAFYYGEPMTVPPGVKGDALEKYRLELEERLNALYHKAWNRFGREEH